MKIYDHDEWRTPEWLLDMVREVLGAIDLDPASCAEANRTVRASTHYSKDLDGLALTWWGVKEQRPSRVWLNPPYSHPLVARFTDKLVSEYELGHIDEAIAIYNNASETAWFQKLLRRFPLCFTAKRISFNHPERASTQNRQGQALFYVGKRISRFAEVFGCVGTIVEKWSL